MKMVFLITPKKTLLPVIFAGKLAMAPQCDDVFFFFFFRGLHPGKINGWNMSNHGGGWLQIIFLSKWVMAVGEPAVNLPGCLFVVSE